ncbi:hypothetical protein L2E82_50003 [Cichorium intybus]|nr:hypothetical protein L2E82_50003 [Cichorium intybus]
MASTTEDGIRPPDPSSASELHLRPHTATLISATACAPNSDRTTPIDYHVCIQIRQHCSDSPRNRHHLPPYSRRIPQTLQSQDLIWSIFRLDFIFLYTRNKMIVEHLEREFEAACASQLNSPVIENGVQKVIPVKQLGAKEENKTENSKEEKKVSQKTSKLPPVYLRIDPPR